jgi:hypothetical protein
VIARERYPAAQKESTRWANPLAGLLSGIDRKAPSVLVHAGIAVARRGLEKEVADPVQARFQVARHLLGIGRQPGALKEGLPPEGPLFLWKAHCPPGCENIR